MAQRRTVSRITQPITKPVTKLSLEGQLVVALGIAHQLRPQSVRRMIRELLTVMNVKKIVWLSGAFSLLIDRKNIQRYEYKKIWFLWAIVFKPHLLGSEMSILTHGKIQQKKKRGRPTGGSNIRKKNPIPKKNPRTKVI